ncbi:MAG: gamma-butyrobetaine hydroxylase-like domain-containing protein [Candidatus Thermoplasmatota archaeon]|nr:gamma-butyrobetaine hydroxylase-like domain-containing protein [Candidatus Thermoplasmatota archaeon]
MSEIPQLRQLERREIDMVLRWKDDTEHILSYVEFRYWCPCANCKPRRETPSRSQNLRDEVDRLRNEKPKAENVGSYGIRFTFTSGCNSGIWSIERLHAIATGSPDPDTL